LKKEILDLNITKDFLAGIAGKHAPELAKIMVEKNKDLTDEEISKKLPLKITEIRTILNQLHYRGIACYNKAKTKRSGWYNYTWNIRTKRIAELLLEKKVEEQAKMEKKQEMEKNYEIFECANSCSQMVFEIAAEYQFKCPGCGNSLEATDNQKTLKDMRKKIVFMKNEMDELTKHC